MQGPAVAPEGDRVAWTETWLDLEKDEPVSSIYVAPADGSRPPRRFSQGGHDSFARWSPDGRHLAYLGADDGPPQLRIAPLEGGEPLSPELPGPTRWIEWSPDGRHLLLVLNIGAPQRAGTAVERNSPRVIRGWVNRLDGAGWMEGRDHLFLYEVSSGALQQLTTGDYDHRQPSFAPDGSSVVFLSDRSADRDERHSEDDIWLLSLRGRKSPRRIATGISYAAWPLFSPDGARVAFSGLPGRETTAARDSRLLVVTADGESDPRPVASGLDRPTAFSFSGQSFAWLDESELVFTVADKGAAGLRRARLGDRRARAVLGGESQVTELSAAKGGAGRTLAFVSLWVDRPPEVYTLALGRRARPPVQVSAAGRPLAAAVKLLPAKRCSTKATDGRELEYFVMAPPRKSEGGRTVKAPLLLEVHGGPHAYHPFCEVFINYQVMAAAGYAVVLANPRGSISYGERFALLARGDWGEGPFADLMACADDAIERGLADGRRQFVSGYSYGGYMSAWSVGHTKRFKAAAIGAPVVSFTSLFGTWDGGSYLADALLGDPWDGGDHLRAQSPLTYSPQVSTPVYLYVNDGDMRCPPSQADELFAALKWHGKEVEYVRYPGGSHLSLLPMAGPPSQNIDRARRMLSFFARHGGERPSSGR